MFWQNAYAGTISLPQASVGAVRVDHLHDFLWWLSVFFLTLVTMAMLVFVKKYHRSKTGRETVYILGNHTLELLWTVIPLIIMLIVFAWGYKDYLANEMTPSNAYEINVVARQWMWNFEYTNGRKTMNEVYIPKGRDVRFLMTSEDVLHSFFIPNFRMKKDVVPGMYTYLPVNATLAGVHPIYCAEYCGTGHSDMLAKVVVLEQETFDSWLESGKLPANIQKEVEAFSPSGAKPAAASAAPGAVVSMAEKGRDVFNNKGCFACHSTDGTKKVGPSLKGAFGREEEFADGTKGKVDENYIRQSVMEPQAKLVKGFPPSMPTFKGLLSDDEVNALIAYIKSLK